MGQTPMAVVFVGSLLRNASLAKGFHDVAGTTHYQISAGSHQNRTGR